MAEEKLSFAALESIVSKIQTGDHSYDEKSFEYLSNYVSGVLYRKLGNIGPETHEDLTSQVMEAVIGGLATWDKTKGSLKTWVNTIIHNKSVDYIRKYNREGKVIARNSLEDTNISGYPISRSTEEAPSEELVTFRELEEIVLNELVKIDAIDRTIYLLKINYDITFHDLTDILAQAGYALTEKAIEQRFYRTRDKLKTVYRTAFE